MKQTVSAAPSPPQASKATEVLLQDLTPQQRDAVCSKRRKLLVIAGAGSGKTDVMARRVAWWVAVEGVPKNSIVAFTFTERAAEEMKFRIRQYIGRITPQGKDATLGGMYVGTIHGFCLTALRELRPEEYHNYDVIDESSRLALIQRGYHGILGLPAFQSAIGASQYGTIDAFLEAYDLLNEYNELDVELASATPPHDVRDEADWCKRAQLKTNVGRSPTARAFGTVAARYYAYLRCRRFLDFSTSQSELSRLLAVSPTLLAKLRSRATHLVVDEVQDINPVQAQIIQRAVGEAGSLTAVGDHRQAIFRWRGGCVDIMASLYEDLKKDKAAEVIELPDNFRSTKRVVDIANAWAKTIGAVRSMSSPDMVPGNARRVDFDGSHIAAASFSTRRQEADWIADKILELVPSDEKGAAHDVKQGKDGKEAKERGLSYTDICILVRSTTDVRTYTTALQRRGIHPIFRAGPDLFSQPEVMLFVALMARAAGLDRFFGPTWAPGFPWRIKETLGCDPTPEAVIRAACPVLRRAGLPLTADAESRLLAATELLRQRIDGSGTLAPAAIKRLRLTNLRDFLSKGTPIRRVFPQAIFHWLLGEAGIEQWDTAGPRGTTAMFHLGALSTLVKGVETPGWTSAGDFKYQISALYLWGSKNARTEEAPLLVPINAVTISTIHAAKGLEYGAVFLADVCKRRFPGQKAREAPKLPFDGPILRKLDPQRLADNANYDDERRLMYVALTRAERYLFVTTSAAGGSCFFGPLEGIVRTCGGAVGGAARPAPQRLRHLRSEFRRDVRLVTSFSDLRYYLECPHDFYLRKVLGFAPTIDQTFGYGRGVHNIMREIHTNPKKWAKLAADPTALKAELTKLVHSGLFYLRYTTGDPLERMRNKAREILEDYVQVYAGELGRLQFEPEKEFETLIEEEQVLVSGAIDIIRMDDPPRVALVDFKSGESDSETATRLDQDEMKLQVSLYGLGAKHELEYEPEKGIVRYIGEKDAAKREVSVDLNDEALKSARGIVAKTAREIRARKFSEGPRRKPRDPRHRVRCGECDFTHICGMKEARDHRNGNGG